MDENAIFERAEVTEGVAELVPRGGPDDGPRFVAEDPETGCRGIGSFEQEARTNLVHAVRAYREDPEATVGYVSAGRGHTFEMRWLREGRFTERIRDALPF